MNKIEFFVEIWFFLFKLTSRLVTGLHRKSHKINLGYLLVVGDYDFNDTTLRCLHDHNFARYREMKDQINPTRKRLNLGIDAIGTVDAILSWDKLEMCFGDSFKFSTETRFEITKELAVQQSRIQKLVSEKKSTKMYNFQESSRKLAEDIENLIETNDKRALSFIADIIKRETGNGVKAFCDTLKSIGGVANDFGSVRPNDLYRDIIRKIVKILLKESISLSLHVQSNLNKFMTELDRQMPETIFPQSSANYIEEVRIRILKDYLRGHLRSS